MGAARDKFGLPINLWLTKEDAVVGLLLSSFLINVLGLIFPICVLQFYDRVIPHKSVSTLAAMVLLIILSLIAELVLKILRAYTSAWSSARFTYGMGQRLFRHLIYADLGQFKLNTAGLYLDRFNSAESIREYYCGQNLTLLVDVPFIFVYLILMCIISFYIACVPILIIIYMLFMSSIATERNFKKIEAKTSFSEAKSKFLIEMISGINTIKSFGMEEQFLRRYERLHKNEILSNYELIQRLSENTRSGALYSQMTVILSGFVGGVLVIYHVVSVGGLAASILIAGRLMLPVTKLITYLEKRKELIIAKEDMHFIMDFKAEYERGLPKIDTVRGEIDLVNVSYKHPEADQYIFKEINLHIAAYETVVFHGPLGSGKSTLLLLIGALYKPTEGKVKVDDHDLSKIDLDSYRNKIAYIASSGELFTGTILENLTLFEPDKYADSAKELAKQLGFHDIIEAMPQSYNTPVGVGTVDVLSKGHKQLIIIIRALVNDPKLIVFDEANSALDIDSDIKLRKYLFSQKGKSTLLLVTHRPSLIAMGDRHIKLENGKLTEFKWQQ